MVKVAEQDVLGVWQLSPKLISTHIITKYGKLHTSMLIRVVESYTMVLIQQEALLHTIWVKNRSVTWALDGKTLYETLYRKKPYLEDLLIWGAKCWILDHSGSKLDDCAHESHWIGFDAKSTAHQIYLPDKCTVVIKHNITFQKVNELVSITVNEPLATNRNMMMNVPGPPAPHAMSSTPAWSKPPISPKPTHLGLMFVNKLPEDVLCWLSCQPTESAYLRLLRTGQGTHDGRKGSPTFSKGIHAGGNNEVHALTTWLDDQDVVFALLAVNVNAEGLEPSTIKEAKLHPDWPKWEEAINAELKSLHDACTWNVVEHPPKGMNIVSCKWIFKIKKNAAGEIDKYKVWLVAHGFT